MQLRKRTTPSVPLQSCANGPLKQRCGVHLKMRAWLFHDTPTQHIRNLCFQTPRKAFFVNGRTPSLRNNTESHTSTGSNSMTGCQAAYTLRWKYRTARWWDAPRGPRLRTRAGHGVAARQVADAGDVVGGVALLEALQHRRVDGRGLGIREEPAAGIDDCHQDRGEGREGGREAGAGAKQLPMGCVVGEQTSLGETSIKKNLFVSHIPQVETKAEELRFLFRFSDP